MRRGRKGLSGKEKNTSKGKVTGKKEETVWFGQGAGPQESGGRESRKEG